MIFSLHWCHVDMAKPTISWPKCHLSANEMNTLRNMFWPFAQQWDINGKYRELFGITKKDLTVTLGYFVGYSLTSTYPWQIKYTTFPSCYQDQTLKWNGSRFLTSLLKRNRNNWVNSRLVSCQQKASARNYCDAIIYIKKRSPTYLPNSGKQIIYFTRRLHPWH